MNSCNSHSLSRYLDGELKPQGRAALEEHLSACPRCTDELEVLRQLDGAVESWTKKRHPMPVQLEMRILNSVQRKRRLPRAAMTKIMPAAVGSSIAALLVVLSANLGWVYQDTTRVGSTTATAQVQQPSAGQPPPAVDVVRIADLLGRRSTAHPDLQAKYGAMINLD